jgi:SNF2 family DNA or RNA helicase
MKLRPYQEEAADFLYEHDRAMILAPVGAGKTAITLTAMRDLVAAENIRFLVVAPLRVAQHVWPVEAAKWTPELRVRAAVGMPIKRAAVLLDPNADVVTMNYENIEWAADLDLSGFTGVVFDELTRLKNPSGKRFKAFEKVIKSVEIRWGLTGSFTSNGLEDVFGQCKVIDQSLLGRSKGAFMQQYFYQNNRGTHTEWEPRPGSLPAVMQRIKPATYVLEPGEYKDKLPPLHTVEMPCSMAMDDYKKMKKDFVLQFGNETTIAQNAAVVTQKLQQMSSGFLYTDFGPRWLSPHKFDALDDILSENQHANTIVVYNYVEELNELRRRYPTLAAMDEKWDVIKGWNAGQVRLLAIHPKSAGHGLNLQHGGHHMIWLSLPWSLELYEQTIGRLHRSGQARDVWNYVLLTADTVDQKIWAALHDKQSLSQLALEALK